MAAGAGVAAWYCGTGASDSGDDEARGADTNVLRVRLHIIRNERIENVVKSQSCMVSKLRIICKQTVYGHAAFAINHSCFAGTPARV